ncbi:isochorismate synthase [Paeniglutamicibacter antarcticus]|uniref:isochorismate synthase n=1 Tax=Arthrobacter terrae TaxID=2935737 RepID=A0A931G474_9MICC|nr:isochorismate synthase [Arthrobacter terrae]MBG0738085.1 isochorismate synthase [Arthrobacter terrae]
MTASLTALTVPLDLSFFTISGHLRQKSEQYGLSDLLCIDGALCWIRRGEGLVAFGELTRFSGTGPERFADAEQWWKALLSSSHAQDSVRLPGTGPVAFGSFAFSKTSSFESRLIIPALVVGFRAGLVWLTQMTLDGGPLTAAGAHAALGLLIDSAARPQPGSPGPLSPEPLSPEPLSPEPLSPEEANTEPPEAVVSSGALSEQDWLAAVAAGVSAIESGALEKVVLARDIVATFAEPVSRPAILQALTERYSECWTYGVEGLVGATPEILIKVEGRTAQARVLAGTLDREDAPEDAAGFAREVLAGSIKQRQEHDFAVRSLTRQLAPFAVDLFFPPEPFILELPNVWHLASDVNAELADVDGHLPTSLALVEALHPTAAVCGTPRSEAGALIRELEGLDRGPYAGPVGWLDGSGNGEWGIALRGAVLENPTTARLYAGCGIVAASDPEAELAETWAKFRPMLQALGLRA